MGSKSNSNKIKNTTYQNTFKAQLDAKYNTNTYRQTQSMNSTVKQTRNSNTKTVTIVERILQNGQPILKKVVKQIKNTVANNTNSGSSDSATTDTNKDVLDNSGSDANTNSYLRSANDLNDIMYSNYANGEDFDPNTVDYSAILTSGTINGIFAMPYQFLPTVDMRIGSKVSDGFTSSVTDKMGRKYAEKVAAHLPLLFLTPCRPKFMEGFNNQDVTNVLTNLITNGANATEPDLSKSGRYYTTQFAYSEYYSCVNLMCAEVAYFCGIQNEEINIDGKIVKIGDINWMEFRNDSFNNYFYAKDSVVLYADGLTTISDSFSNTTTDSMLASTVNGFSDTAKELNFILGENSALAKIKEFAEDAASNIGDALGGIIDITAGGMLKDIADTGISTIMTGGKMLFPKIWGDSTFSRSYSFDIKLRSPDHDSVSIFMNILVPYIHLLALCMPQSITRGDAAGSPNSYNSPFLLRAYSKGQFNINMGIITEMSVTRGGEAQWNDNGLPTQMDISITIEDLYNTLFMTNPNKEDTPLFNFSSLKAIFNLDIVANTEMLDFLANLAGLNIAGEELGRRTRMSRYLTINQLARTPANIYNYFSNGVSNLIRGMYETV